MRLLKLFVSALLFCSSVVGVYAQNILLKVADKHMEQLRYADAAELYEVILEKNPEALSAKANIAKAYRRMCNFKSAEYWYGQLVLSPEVKSIEKLHYAQVLQRNGKCPLAERWFEKYRQEKPDDVRGQLLARSCEYKKELMTKNADIYEVKQLWFNSSGDDFSPTFFADGLIFSSEREEGQFTRRSAGWDERPFLNLYKVRMVASDQNISTTCNFVYTEPLALNSSLNTRFHEGSTVFSSDEEEVFITKSDIVEENLTIKSTQFSKLFHARKLRGEWTEPELLPFNGKQYSVAHPALSPDGKYLYFASDMPGGYGGMDIYRVERVENRWGALMNLGPNINTEGNEVFPTCDDAGRLFFASNGQIGLGGLDVYSTEETAIGQWAIPENLGYPINSIADDFGIIFNNEGTCGYFTSNRVGGTGGDDVYSFVKQTASMQVLVYDDRTLLPLTTALVEDTCSNQVFMTNAKGKVIFDMPLDRCCTFTAAIEGYEIGSVEGCTEFLTPGEQVYVEIPLKRKLNFSVTGIVFDQYTGLPLNNSTVNLLSDCDKETPFSITTDASGRFTFSLKEQCCYSIQASHEQYRGTTQEDYCTNLNDSKEFISKVYLMPKSN